MRMLLLALLALALATPAAHAQIGTDGSPQDDFCKWIFFPDELTPLNEALCMAAFSPHMSLLFEVMDELPEGWSSQMSMEKVSDWCDSEYPTERLGWSDINCTQTVYMLTNLPPVTFSANGRVIEVAPDEIVNLDNLASFCSGKDWTFGCLNLAEEQMKAFHATLRGILRTDPDASMNLDMEQVARWCSSQFPTFEYGSSSIVCTHTVFLVDRLPSTTFAAEN